MGGERSASGGISWPSTCFPTSCCSSRPLAWLAEESPGATAVSISVRDKLASAARKRRVDGPRFCMKLQFRGLTFFDQVSERLG